MHSDTSWHLGLLKQQRGCVQLVECDSTCWQIISWFKDNKIDYKTRQLNEAMVYIFTVVTTDYDYEEHCVLIYGCLEPGHTS